MKHLQTYELTRREHAEMKRAPFLLIVPPSANAQEITLTVESRRNLAPKASSANHDGAVACPDCKATAGLNGKPFTVAGMKKHRYQAHKRHKKVRK